MLSNVTHLPMPCRMAKESGRLKTGVYLQKVKYFLCARRISGAFSWINETDKGPIFMKLQFSLGDSWREDWGLGAV